MTSRPTSPARRQLCWRVWEALIIFVPFVTVPIRAFQIRRTIFSVLLSHFSYEDISWGVVTLIVACALINNPHDRRRRRGRADIRIADRR